MAEGQRRRVLDTGIGVNLLSKLTGGVAEQLAEKRKAEQELELVFQKALAEAKIKEAFPSAEEQTQRKLLGLAEEEGQPRFGAGQIGPPTSTQAFADQTRQSKITTLLRILGKGPSAGMPTNVFFADPYADTVTPAPGGANLPPGSRVIPRRTTPEEAEERSEATGRGGAKGRQEVKYADLSKQFSFISQDVDSVLGFLDEIPSGRARGPAAQIGAAFGMEGSENVLQYTRTKDLILSKIAKTFGGEVGVLTEGDIKRISRGFPAIWMNDRERQAASKWVKDYIQRRIEAYKPGVIADSQVGRFQEGQTATNPRTGETLTYRNGQWQ